MKVQSTIGEGLLGQTISLNIQEMIILADLLQVFDARISKESDLAFHNVSAFLHKALGNDVKTLDQTTEEMFGNAIQFSYNQKIKCLANRYQSKSSLLARVESTFGKDAIFEKEEALNGMMYVSYQKSKDELEYRFCACYPIPPVEK